MTEKRLNGTLAGLMLAILLTGGCSRPADDGSLNTDARDPAGNQAAAGHDAGPDEEIVAETDAEKNADRALAERAGAPLFEGMGDYGMTITTRSPEAQRYFNQGMVLAFAFNHAESVRSFQAAQTLDPTCAMCFWGEALATGPNINVTSNGKAIMAADDRVRAFEVSRKAESLMASASAREQAYITRLSL